MNWVKSKIRSIIFKKEMLPVYVEEVDDITDEIERALWLIKEDLDLPTEEVDQAVEGRRTCRRKNI